MDIVTFLVCGAVAGFLAGQFTKGSGFGLVGNLIVGVIGALVGGFVFPLLGLHIDGILGYIVMSTVGAVILLFLLVFLAKKKATG